MTQIPDDFNDDDFDPDRFWGYVHPFPRRPEQPVMRQPKASLRIQPRKFDPRYRKAGEESPRRKERHFNQQAFWQVVSWIGMSGLIILLVALVVFLISLQNRSS